MPTTVFPVDTATGTLTINGVNLHTYAWCCLDLRRLTMPEDYDVKNVKIPGAHGTRPYRYWIAEATHDLQMFITGRVNSAGTPNANPFLGYQTNIAYLKANLLTPPSGGTFVGSILLPSGATVTADVQVLGFKYQEFDPQARFFQKAALTVRVPAGLFS